MNTIKIYLAESGRIADLKKDFPLYQGQFQNKLLNVYVPTSILAPNFTVQESGSTIADYISSTAIKIGLRTTERNGKIYVSKTYYMRYLKTLSYQGVEYALYERKLPQEFTTFAGQGQNAPQIVANVVNIDNDTTPATIISITATQICSLDVMPSTYLDKDETIEEPSELSALSGQINEINAILPNKQNKVDELLETTNKSVVGAINENKRQLDTNTQNIAENTEDIAQNRNDIDELKQTIGTGQDYIGTMTVSSLPNTSQLNSFVQTTKGRAVKGGDTIIVILQVADDTDRSFKYIYNGTDWTSYEIPPVEEASNGTKGLIEGTYGVENYNTLVDVSGGQIRNIYIKGNDGNYKNIFDYVNMNAQDIEDIINGDTVVGEAMKAVEDGLGNNIANTYLTQVLGATKQFVRDYAQPREFGSVYFVSADGFVSQIPTTPESGIQFSVETTSVGDYQLFEIDKTNGASFELTSINGYSNNLYISANNDSEVQFRLTTEYQKQGEDWNVLNVELSNLLMLKADEIQRVQLNAPFTALGDNVLMLNVGDKIRQRLEIISQSSIPTMFYLYSNEIYPSTFSITSQSYILDDIEKSKSQIIIIGADGIIESNNVVLTVQNADAFLEYRTNQREFLLNGNVPVVGEIDPTFPIRIQFGETVYNLYSFLKGGNEPLTFGDIVSSTTYNSNLGYSFDIRVMFLQTSDISGFVLSPATLTAEEFANTISNSGSVVAGVGNDKKVTLTLEATLLSKLMRALVTPMTAPSTGSYEIAGIDDTGSQVNLLIGDGLYVADGQIKVTGGGGSGGTTNYQDLDNKPILNSNNTTSQTPNSNEVLNGTINLHKVSKTGALADTIQDSSYRTVSDTEKSTWNNIPIVKGSTTNGYIDINNVDTKVYEAPLASTAQVGDIQIATDSEAQAGTNTTKAVTPKHLKTAIDSIGSVFTLKGSVQSVSNLPSTGNEIGDVYYVINENVGYIWLNDGTTNRWEQLGLPIDLSNYIDTSDIVNNLTSTATDKPLSANQGKVLDGKITTTNSNLATTNSNLATANSNISALQTADTNNVKLTGNQTVAGVKTFSSAPKLSTNTISTSSGNTVTFPNATSTLLNTGSAQTISGVKTFSGAPKISATLAGTLNDTTMSTTAWVRKFLKSIYPVGAIYISTASTSPATLIGGTWSQLPANTALWTATSGAGGTIAAGLPNITGTCAKGAGDQALTNGGESEFSNTSGALSLVTGSTTSYIYTKGGDASRALGFAFDASKSNSIYGKSTTVQPPAYKIYAWKRTA